MLQAVLAIFILAASPIWPIGENPIDGDPFVIVNVDRNQLAFIEDGRVKEVLPAATGKQQSKTPLGLFTITVKAEQPYYRKKDIPGGDPTNPLGSRWIGFDAEETEGRTYGVHGTNQPSSVGYAVTSGCIRLTNENIVELYDRVPIGTKILITTKQLSFEELAIEYGAIRSAPK
ncbi:L,D-transpeptidase [Alkalicoccobacillus murimartini]|uniref:Lipoprotein-anchoring transpeptidase ErfK/SrfK n=1 Tax=Alkalicoccobacillus murimartini TaxID=171685 RepID=A0ABT9YD26_9BACI|nr:L,D-transpeptidase [Alkalicoccobacillus murimartini]MDQ0205629.1 lipoprotein-anchoring transpeptidase ErfK/SrfK [Alkalicoccobacillus murimartini]